MENIDNLEQVEVESPEQLREWLEKHHDQLDSIWLVTFKKTEVEKYMSTNQVLDELLCYGWIDGIRRKVDVKRTMQLISPRKTQHWAKTYKDRANRLIEEGRMQAPGLRSIEISKENGLWNFMDDVDKLIKPNDLSEALSQSKEAQEFFDQINDSSKRFVLRWLKLAKTKKTRLARIDRIVELSRNGQKLPGS